MKQIRSSMLACVSYTEGSSRLKMASLQLLLTISRLDGDTTDQWDQNGEIITFLSATNNTSTFSRPNNI